jgi:hypothetical protein
MRKLILLALCGLFLCENEVKAQQADKCATQLIREQYLTQHPEYKAAAEHQRLHLQLQDEAYQQLQQYNVKEKTTANVVIPVIFHVVVTQSQLDYLGGVAGVRKRMQTQLDALNKDFGGLNADSTTIPSPFKPLFNKASITFAPAHRSPSNTSTEGFEIKITTMNSFSAMQQNGNQVKYTNFGGVDAWDPEKYLNIWVANITEGSILGFAIPPSFIQFGYQKVETGVVLRYSIFGRKTTATEGFSPASNNMGRTCVHEVGHFFELEHVFGHSSGCPGPGPTGDVDDGISDTPPQADKNFSIGGNCPAFPKTDVCSPTGNGVMWMNYMDYVDDKCMVMFTKGQGTRMMNQLNPGGPSHSLTQHLEVLDWPTDVASIEKESGLNIYPNPSNGAFRVAFADAKGLKEITVLNIMSQKVYSINTSNPGITKYDIDLTGLSKGVYLVQCSFATGTVTKKIVLQ